MGSTTVDVSTTLNEGWRRVRCYGESGQTSEGSEAEGSEGSEAEGSEGSDCSIGSEGSGDSEGNDRIGTTKSDF